MTTADREADAPDFLALVKRRDRGKLKLYIGSAAGVGKTYRISEAHGLRGRDTDVVIGFVETHKRVDTEAQREVAGAVDRSREEIVRRETGEVPSVAPRTVERVLVAMSSNPPYTAALLRQASRIAGRLNPDRYCVYVQTSDERADRIDSTVQRTLVDNIHLAQTMGVEVVKLEGDDVVVALCWFAVKKGVTLVIVGQSKRSRLHYLRKGSVVERLVNNNEGLDVLVVSFDPATPAGRAAVTMSHWLALAFVPAMAALLYVARRVKRTVGGSAGQAVGTSDEIERVVDRLSNAVEMAEGKSADREKHFEQRARDYARLLASIADASARRLEDVRLPLHILLENHFGDLNENQEEMLGAARAAAEAVDADMLSLREIAALDLGERPLRQDCMKPSEMIDAVRPLLFAAASSAGVALEFDVTPLLPAITGDRALLQDALVTVLRESVLSSGREARVRISVDREGPLISFILSGGGVPAITVRLAAAVRVVQAHGGSVVRSAADVRNQLPATGAR